MADFLLELAGGVIEVFFDLGMEKIGQRFREWKRKRSETRQ